MSKVSTALQQGLLPRTTILRLAVCQTVSTMIITIILNGPRWSFISVPPYRTLCPFARASPLPRVPRVPPRAAPPRPDGTPPPRLDVPVVREVGAGVVNLGVGFEEVGGFSTKDVSVVLDGISL